MALSIGHARRSLANNYIASLGPYKPPRGRDQRRQSDPTADQTQPKALPDTRPLAGLPNLLYLDLSNNNLSVISPGDFSGTPELVFLNLSDNSDLDKVSQAAVAALPNLATLYAGPDAAERFKDGRSSCCERLGRSFERNRRSAAHLH
jgi:Leucine-rich repeat (LRR) protein